MTARTVVPARAGHAAASGRRALATRRAGVGETMRAQRAAAVDRRGRSSRCSRCGVGGATRLILCEPEVARGDADGARPADAAGARRRAVRSRGRLGAEEVALAIDLGWRPWTCSPFTMRAETAPIVALGIMGWIRRPQGCADARAPAGFTEHGAGPPLLLVHGVMITGEMFAPVLDHFAARHRVIVPDLRGHGRSRALPPPYTVERLARRSRRSARSPRRRHSRRARLLAGRRRRRSSSSSTIRAAAIASCWRAPTRSTWRRS